ncbi:Type 1 phosphatases regulator ypi1 [Tieghemiomyces parasiticus]|uniref:Type 1 phosphatases regulator n=1 Tax=Tieghemiomyces parasiticus TaxID=78921 RepID=A0A9W8DP61_9FUNG|nr:Type 1 phosphatases regulator ypi1 [Tieghemiomyces parasiticus]
MPEIRDLPARDEFSRNAPGADVPGSLTRERQRQPTHGSRTMTITGHEQDHEDRANIDAEPEVLGVLHLQGDAGASSQPRPRVRWDVDVVDNEDLNRKKSKVCCIFRKARRFDESDSDETDSDDSSCASDAEHGSGCSRHHGSSRNADLPPPNEYERMPRYNKRKSAAS